MQSVPDLQAPAPRYCILVVDYDINVLNPKRSASIRSVDLWKCSSLLYRTQPDRIGQWNFGGALFPVGDIAHTEALWHLLGQYSLNLPVYRLMP